MSTMKGDESVARLVTGYHSLSVSHRNKGAVIYHALQDGTNAPAALKVLRLKDPIVAPTDGEELATMLRLSAHPHIVSIFATGVTTTGRPCVAMQYCQGGSYADILAARGALPVARVVETGVAIASALAAAHAEGLLHGAVTPSNILQTQAGPALTDFPISRPPEDLTGTLGMSTPYHAAPEVLLGRRRSEPSDVYGLASTLWTLLAGHPPFARPGDTELDFFAYRERALADPAPPVAADIMPAELQAALDKALSQDPAHRYGSAEEFGTVLSAIETQISPKPQPAPAGRQLTQAAINPGKSRPGWGFFDTEPDLDPPTLAASPHGAVDPTPDAVRPDLSGRYSTVPEQAPGAPRPAMSPQYPTVSGSVPQLDYVLDYDSPEPAPVPPPEPAIPAPGSTTSVPQPHYLIEQEFSTPEPATEYPLEYDAPEPEPEPAPEPEPVTPAPGPTASVPQPQYLIEQEIPTPEPATEYPLEYDAPEPEPEPAPEPEPEPVIPTPGSTGTVPEPQYLVDPESSAPEPAPALGYLLDRDSPEPEPEPSVSERDLADYQSGYQPGRWTAPVEIEPIPPGRHRSAQIPLTYPRSRRSTYVRAGIAGVSLGLIVVVALALRGGSSPEPSARPSSPAVAAPLPSGEIITPRADAGHTPEQVRMTDRQLVVALSWQDRSAGKASYYVVGGPVGRTPTTLAEVPAGGTKTEISGLNPQANYCFTVLAVLDVDQVGAAEPICTKRRT